MSDPIDYVKETDFRFRLGPERTRYVYRVLSKLGTRKTSLFFKICVDFFWLNHPLGSTTKIAIDSSKRVYMVLDVEETNNISVLESGTYTSSETSLIHDIRKRWPDARLQGEEHVYNITNL